MCPVSLPEESLKFWQSVLCPLFVKVGYFFIADSALGVDITVFAPPKPILVFH